MPGEQYHDNSSGATGAKSFGPHSQAHSTGNIAQSVRLPESTAELAESLRQLLALLEGVQAGDPGPVNEVKDSLRQGLEAVEKKPDPDAVTFMSTWEKVKGWLSGALSLGMFAAEKAEQVRLLIERIGSFFK